MRSAIVFYFFALLACALAEVVQFQPCSEKQTISCSVKEVRVDPCPEAAKNAPCICRKGKNATIAFDFEAKAGASFSEAQAYWPTALGDIPLAGMDTEACKYTSCPIKDGIQTYTYALLIKKEFPAAKYTVKWRLWHEEEVSCCFLFKIDIKKK